MSVAQSNYFEHDPLDQSQPSIRLVKILRKKSRGGLLQCEVHHTTVDASYICLSYVWGEPPTADGLRPILINGKRFSVRPNLYAFLTASRSRYSKTMLWIDALCIDQMNTLERNHQVQQMGEIFSRAEYVIAWLGDDRFAGRSLVMFRAMASYSQARSLVNFLSTLLHLIRLNDDDHLYAALREYWSRAWITQEVALACQVKFRARKAEWKLPASLDQHWEDISKPPSQGGDTILYSILRLSTTRHDDWQYGLMELLCGLVYKNCSDPRDRIYSLLSLCRERDVLKVDYGISEVRLLCHVLKTSNATCF
ncbi:heterokaryon incompatibility protein-domain-containing protein, partial [Paraphoma chrysanthemicola]